jgi:hypothetical protein
MWSIRYSRDIWIKLDFLDRFSKETQIWNFMKNRPVGAELFHADRRTDMTKRIVSFHNLAKAFNKKKNGSCSLRQQSLFVLNKTQPI